MKIAKIKFVLWIFCAFAVIRPVLADTPGLADLQRRAEAGNVAAENQLGILYAQGRGTEQSFPKAIEWWQKAAAHHGAAAMTNLGLLYLRGAGVQQDDDKAAAWFKKSADLGYVPGQFWMGYMYQHGIGVNRDIEHAKLLYGLAAYAQFKPAVEALAQITGEQALTSKNNGKDKGSGMPENKNGI